MNSQDEARTRDPVRHAAKDLIGFWREHLYVGVGYTAAEVISKACETRDTSSDFHTASNREFIRPEFRDFLVTQAGMPRGDIDGRKMGKWLTSIRGQVHDGHRIELMESSGHHGKRYALKKVETSPAEATAEEAGGQGPSSPGYVSNSS